MAVTSEPVCQPVAWPALWWRCEFSVQRECFVSGVMHIRSTCGSFLFLVKLSIPDLSLHNFDLTPHWTSVPSTHAPLIGPCGNNCFLEHLLCF